jgi:hypothetical protein
MEQSEPRMLPASELPIHFAADLLLVGALPPLGGAG